MCQDVTDTAAVGWIVSERRVVATVRTATRRGRELERLIHCNAARLLSFLGNPFYSIPFPYLQFYYITSYASTYPPVFLQ